MMNKNNNLHAAKTAKNDEFFTQLPDIENELHHYKEHFKDKIILCNCDDPCESNFWLYFAQNFEFLGLKKLIATHFESEIASYKLEIVRDVNGDGKIDRLDTIRTPLEQNGDFRSPECIELLKEADIIVTNPPFSLFREYVAQLIEYDKKFIIIGSQNAITYKETFKLIKDNKIWLGTTYPKGFKQPDGSIKKFGNICWYTNLDYKKRHEDLFLTKEYNPEDYPKYDNCEAINVDLVKNIPRNYEGFLGVPITYLGKHSPDQFDIVALGIVGSIDFSCNKKMEILDKCGISTGKYTHNAKGTLYVEYDPRNVKPPSFKNVDTGELYQSIYARIIIRNKRLGET